VGVLHVGAPAEGPATPSRAPILLAPPLAICRSSASPSDPGWSGLDRLLLPTRADPAFLGGVRRSDPVAVLQGAAGLGVALWGRGNGRQATGRANSPGRSMRVTGPPVAPAIAARLRSQLLAGALADSTEKVVGRLLAVQAQDGRGARLAIRSRSSGLSATDIDRALSRDRSLVVTWLNRGTLHLVRSGDYWWLHGLTAARSTIGSERRLRQEGVDARQAVRGVELIAKAVTDDGPLTREQLRQRLETAGVPTAGQALVHLLGVASTQGAVLRGPMVGAEHAFVAVDQWLGPAPPALDREEALAALARRYLDGHAPGRPEDLAKWAGITLGDARVGFAAIDNDYVSVDEGLLAPGALADAPMPAPRLLGPFDPLLLAPALCRSPQRRRHHERDLPAGRTCRRPGGGHLGPPRGAAGCRPPRAALRPGSAIPLGGGHGRPAVSRVAPESRAFRLTAIGAYVPDARWRWNWSGEAANPLGIAVRRRSLLSTVRRR
jgi:hypothetical protein